MISVKTVIALLFYVTGNFSHFGNRPSLTDVILVARSRTIGRRVWKTLLCTLLFACRFSAQPLAFPTAEGAGKFTVGGRGGAVYEVTNLNDDGPGSLRAAVMKQGPRTVVFRISGTISLNSPLIINEPNITIAGQTAPGDGICLRDQTVAIEANEVIMRHIRVRLGDRDTAGQGDALAGKNGRNIIVDHCSVSWSIDEAMSIYSGVENLTVQWCFITESLRFSHHVKGEHGYGGIWGGKNSSWHHNLLAHHTSRNPRFDRGVERIDFRNNVIYNWKYNSSYGGEAKAQRRSTINVVLNYYKAGPATDDGPMQYRIVNPWANQYGFGQWYIDGNVVVGFPEVTANNWLAGVQGIGKEVPAHIRVDRPFSFMPINQQSPEIAYRAVLAHGGASLPGRDTIDRRIVWEVENDTALYGGRSGEHTGIIDSQDAVGGWPLLKSVSVPIDSDHDGIPDAWETAHSLNPKDPKDRNKIGREGYTKLEEYINELAADTKRPRETKRSP
jgi:pectate lyase